MPTCVGVCVCVGVSHLEVAVCIASDTEGYQMDS